MNEIKVMMFDPFDGDYGDPNDLVLSDKIVTIRKPRECFNCKGTAQKGSRCRTATHKVDMLMTYTWCHECTKAMESDDDLDYIDRCWK